MKSNFFLICTLVAVAVNLLLLLSLSTSDNNHFVDALRREWALLDPLNTATNYHTIIYRDSSSSPWKSLLYNSGITLATKQNLCRALGWTRVDGAATQPGAINASYPIGLYVALCWVGSNGVFSDVESSCAYANYSSPSANPLQINCTGLRMGGEYGVWADPFYIRLDYLSRFQVREAFSLSWKYYCDDAFGGTTTAGAICSMLDTGKIQRTGTYTSRNIDSTADFGYYGLNCASSTYRNLSQCYSYYYNSYYSYCYPSEGLAILCSQNSGGVVSGNYRFRLQQSSYPNILEVLPSSSSSTITNWGRVCDNGFSAYSDAVFFCKLLGFPSGRASFYSTWSGTSFYSNPFYLTNVDCQDSYTSFVSCTYSTSSSSLSICGTNEAVNLQCPQQVIQAGSAPITSGTVQLRTLSSNSQIQVRNTGDTEWDLICADGSSKMSFETSSALGNFLGRGDQCSWTVSTGLTGQPFKMTELRCYYYSTGMSSCTYIAPTATSSCSSSSSALALGTCWYYSQGVKVGNYHMRISRDGLNRLEVRPNSSTTWGTICYNCGAYSYTTVSTSTVYYLCKMLGFTPSTYFATSTSGGTGPVYFVGLYCTSYSNSLDYCSTSSTSYTDYVSGQGNDLSIHCGNYMDTSSTVPVTPAPSPGSPADSSSSSTALDASSNIGIIMGAVWGGIIFIVVVALVCVNACRASMSSSSSIVFSSDNVNSTNNNNNNNNNNIHNLFTTNTTIGGAAMTQMMTTLPPSSSSASTSGAVTMGWHRPAVAGGFSSTATSSFGRADNSSNNYNGGAQVTATTTPSTMIVVGSPQQAPTGYYYDGGNGGAGNNFPSYESANNYCPPPAQPFGGGGAGGFTYSSGYPAAPPPPPPPTTIGAPDQNMAWGVPPAFFPGWASSPILPGFYPSPPPPPPPNV